MKILWVSNGAFTGTGYGTATRSVTNQLKKDGHDPHVLAYWGIQGGAKLSIDGVMHYSPRSDIWANDYMEDLSRFLRCDFTLIHRDIWVNSVEMENRFPFAAWFPVDHAPVSKTIVEHVERAEWKASISKFGVQQLANHDVEVDYVPHSFDSDIFSYSRSLEGRDMLGIPKDAFLITMVADNKGVPSRKGFPEMYEAIAEMQRRHPDVWAYNHSIFTEERQGINLQKLLEFKECDPARFKFVDPFLFFFGIDYSVLAKFYQASDVLLHTSYGEGFGLTILEAQSCGTPVVTTNTTAMPEITFNGYSVDGYKFFYPFFADWIVPKVGEIVDALEELYKAKGSKKQEKKNKDTADMIYNEWRDEVVYDKYWKPWLGKIENDLENAREKAKERKEAEIEE